MILKNYKDLYTLYFSPLYCDFFFVFYKEKYKFKKAIPYRYSYFDFFLVKIKFKVYFDDKLGIYALEYKGNLIYIDKNHKEDDKIILKDTNITPPSLIINGIEDDYGYLCYKIIYSCPSSAFQSIKDVFISYEYPRKIGLSLHDLKANENFKSKEKHINDFVKFYRLCEDEKFMSFFSESFNQGKI